MSGPQRLLPVVDDLDTGGFFEAAQRGELVVRMCNGCDNVLHVPVAYCHRCGSWDGRWQPVSGRGRVYSWTTVDHQVHPAYPVPYTLVLVELEDHPQVRMLGRLEGSPQLTVGQPMQVTFETMEGDVTLPQWEPV